MHFFLDDYRFETVWTKPQRALSRLARVGATLTPDFSLWRDMPLCMQLWQVYRARWCGAWLLHHGITVIPTLNWSTPDTFPFAFTGITPGSAVAISTVGVHDATARHLLTAGYTEMLTQLRPSVVLVYGRDPAQLMTESDARNVRQETTEVRVRCYPTRWQQVGL